MLVLNDKGGCSSIMPSSKGGMGMGGFLCQVVRVVRVNSRAM